jgi:hypothetical protein
VQIIQPLMMLQLMVLVPAGYSDTFLSFTTLLVGTHLSSYFGSRYVGNPVEQIIVSLCWYHFMSATCVNWTCCRANMDIVSAVTEQNCEERVRRMTVNKKEKVVSLLVKAWCMSMLAVCLITWVRDGWNAVTLQLLDSKQFTKTSDH